MTSGITVFNDSHTVQIDHEYKNVCLAQKGTVASGTKSDGSFFATVQHVDITYTANSSTPPSLIVLGTAMNYLFLLSQSGNTFTWRAIFGNSNSSVTADYWIFDKPPNSSTSSFGFQVFDPTGNLSFDALFKYANVVGIMNMSWQTNTPSTFSVPAGKTYIPLQMTNGQIVASVPIQQAPGLPVAYMQQFQATGVKRVSGALQTERDNRSAGPYPVATPSVVEDANYLILDVTEF